MTVGRDLKLNWLKDLPSRASGTTWGVPWRKGELNPKESIILTASSGKNIPVQSWPTAYWPDGSIKWTAHAASFSECTLGPYCLNKGEPPTFHKSLSISETEEHIKVDSGKMACVLNRSGTSFIHTIYCEDRQVCTDGKLIGIKEVQSQLSGARVYKQEDMQSDISRAVIEQRGPVRSVIRFEGKHRLVSGNRKWLPFQLRLYFYANQDAIKMVHSFIYDGNPHEDFIKGLGLSFSIPMSGPLYNRHVRFAGDKGFFSESPNNLATRRTTGKYEELFKQQQSGKCITLDTTKDESFLALLDDAAVWDSFKLTQLSADSYTVRKRTKNSCSWLKAVNGNRARGLVFAGNENGGLAIGMRSFWQKHPSSFALEGMAGDEATLNVWFWSPDAEAMDLRHYDTETHLESSYEGFEEMRSTPYGIANTSELNLWCLEETPERNELEQMVQVLHHPPLLVCDPEYYHQVKAFGTWSLPDRSTEAKAALEDQLDQAVQFYMQETEQRKWYGFWDYGDVMHTYDAVRHSWRYDIGGFAWQNTELVPNMWLWYMFLRSGREDIFRFAEAMTRHTSEVDVYHAGEYAGLGSRHNVVHWGCGCKEARISMAGLHRFYYYLTADERIGDIMNEVTDADFTTVNLDPMRAYFPKDEHPTHTRMGPDWAAFVSNWMTRWERYEDTEYRDKILTGIEDLKGMPFRMKTLAVYGYDPKTGHLHDIGDHSGGHLTICMGGPQVWMELAEMLEDPEWESMLAEIGAFYNQPREEKIRQTSLDIPQSGYHWPMFSTGITAFAAKANGDADLAGTAWRILLEDRVGRTRFADEITQVADYVRPIQEIPWISTNTVSQWSLNAIVCLELIGKWLPDKVTSTEKHVQR